MFSTLNIKYYFVLIKSFFFLTTTIYEPYIYILYFDKYILSNKVPLEKAIYLFGVFYNSKVGLKFIHA